MNLSKRNIINELTSQIKEIKDEKIKDYDLTEILEKCNISLDDFDNYFDTINYTRERQMEKEEKYRIKGKDSIAKYCNKNKYYYPLVYRLIKKSIEKNIPLNMVIRDYKENRRTISINIIGSPDEMLLERQLRFLGLCHGYIHKDIMYYKSTPEEAIMNEIFRQNIKKGYNWLELIYDYYAENIIMLNKVNYNLNIKKIENKLNEEEKNIINELLNKFEIILKQYKYLRVGCEKDREKRIKLIKKYDFDNEEIKKSVIYSFILNLKTKYHNENIEINPLVGILFNFNNYSKEELLNISNNIKKNIYDLIEYHNNELVYSIKNR